MPSRINDYTRRRIVFLHEKKYSSMEIRRTLVREGLSGSYRSILHIISKYEETGKLEDKYRPGRKRTMHPRTEEIIDKYLRANDELTAPELQIILQEETGSTVSQSAIRRMRLKNHNWMKSSSKSCKATREERAVTVAMQPGVKEPVVVAPTTSEDSATVTSGNRKAFVNSKKEYLLRFVDLSTVDEQERKQEERRIGSEELVDDSEQVLLQPAPTPIPLQEVLPTTPTQKQLVTPSAAANAGSDSLLQRAASLEKLVAKLKRRKADAEPSLSASSSAPTVEASSPASPLTTLVNCLDFSPDLEMMVTGADDGRVRVFNRVKGQLVTRLRGHKEAIKGVAISGSSKLIASASMDGCVHVWQTCDAQLLLKLTGHASGVETVAFSCDASLLCSGGWDCTAIVWNLKTGTPQNILTGHGKAILCCAFSPKDDVLATGSWDNDIRLWAYGKSKVAGSCQVLKGHGAAVHSVTFSGKGMLASGSHDKKIFLWNPRGGVLLRELTGHAGWVRALSFNLSGTMLASAGDDETCKLWDVLSGECAKTMELHNTIGQVHCVVFGVDDKLIVGGANILKDKRKHRRNSKSQETVSDETATK